MPGDQLGPQERAKAKYLPLKRLPTNNDILNEARMFSRKATKDDENNKTLAAIFSRITSQLEALPKQIRTDENTELAEIVTTLETVLSQEHALDTSPSLETQTQKQKYSRYFLTKLAAAVEALRELSNAPNNQKSRRTFETNLNAFTVVATKSVFSPRVQEAGAKIRKGLMRAAVIIGVIAVVTTFVGMILFSAGAGTPMVLAAIATMSKAAYFTGVGCVAVTGVVYGVDRLINTDKPSKQSARKIDKGMHWAADKIQGVDDVDNFTPMSSMYSRIGK